MDMEKTYEPAKYEATIYKQWEEAGAFKPVDRGAGAPFTIIMPPPNANGALHAGHAVGYTLTDIIVRYKRMQGFTTLWQPGTDHAGIETQFVYERDVLAPKHQSRFDIGPQQFYQDLLAFTKTNEQTILNQMRAMGFSADWNRTKFTLDADIVDIVYGTFIQMHKDGLVYRGNRIINWCPVCQSSFADIEISHRSQEDGFYTLDYGPIKIATTRPETIFADVAVAVNPKDKRYTALVGKEAVIPLVDRPIPIIADSYVDPKAGTGALKVTPAHDPHDYEIGLTHKLPEISVIDHEGKLVNVPQAFAGLKATAARAKVIEALKTAGKLTAEQTITHAVGYHERCGTQIEPLLSEQWFLRVKDLNQAVVRALEGGEVKFFPTNYKRIALNWLAQEHDWNISRQNWYGIKMPIYYKTSHDPAKEDYLVAKTETEAKAYYGEGHYRAETDTFDTWFSSGQWPYATLMTTGGFDQFYPTDLMGTAREILHKWVTRMIMFGLYKTGKVPFKSVYLWGLITDEKGHKMSKSKGNVIDPLTMSQQYGTDALRLAGAISNTPGTDSPLSPKQIEAMRNFSNKLWNIARFVLAAKPSTGSVTSEITDKWWQDTLSNGISQISTLIDQYRLNEAANRLYHLVWDDFADWYIEASKVTPNPELLTSSLATILKLAHPFVPFVTEAIWAKLPNRSELLITSAWPKPGQTFPAEATQFAKVQALVGEYRTITSELDLGKPPIYHQDAELDAKDITSLLQKLTGASKISRVEGGLGIPIMATGGKAWIEADRPTISGYQSKLAQKLTGAQAYVDQLTKQLANPEFSQKADKTVVEAAQQRLKDGQANLAAIKTQIDHLAKL